MKKKREKVIVSFSDDKTIQTKITAVQTSSSNTVWKCLKQKVYNGKTFCALKVPSNATYTNTK